MLRAYNNIAAKRHVKPSYGLYKQNKILKFLRLEIVWSSD